jgi:hypothetical protein
VLNGYTHYFALIIIGIELLQFCILEFVKNYNARKSQTEKSEFTVKNKTISYFILLIIPILLILPYFLVPGHPLGDLLSYFNFTSSQSILDYLNTTLNFLSALWPYDIFMHIIRVILIILSVIFIAINLAQLSKGKDNVLDKSDFTGKLPIIAEWFWFYVAISLLILFYIAANDYSMAHVTRYFVFIHILTLPVLCRGIYNVIQQKTEINLPRWQKQAGYLTISVYFVGYMFLFILFYFTYYPTGRIMSN